MRIGGRNLPMSLPRAITRRQVWSVRTKKKPWMHATGLVRKPCGFLTRGWRRYVYPDEVPKLGNSPE